MKYKKVKNYGSQVGYCKEGVCITFDTYKEYNDACTALVSDGFDIAPYDNCYQCLTMHKEDAEKVRLDAETMVHWNKETGRKISLITARLMIVSGVVGKTIRPFESLPKEKK